MKIVVVNYAYDPALGDAEELLSRYHSLTEWCEALQATGAGLVTVVQRFRTDAAFRRGGVEYRFYADGLFRRFRMPLGTRLCDRLVRAADPDVVHVNGLDFPIDTWLLRRAVRSDAALVVQDHASGDPKARRSMAHAARRSVRRGLMRTVDGFLFTSTTQARAWQHAGLISASQPVYEVLESSTNIKPVDRTAARRETGTDGNPAVLWVGRLNANKDPLTVLDGFERALARLPAARLSMLYSEGDLLTAVRERMRASPTLSASVRLIGHVPYERVASFYSAADLFVVGSHHESCGYALMEACACGLTPAVTDIPAFHAITGGGSIGKLWRAGDSSALADAIVHVAHIDGQHARSRVFAYFERTLSWPAVAQAAMRAYQSAVARRHAKTA